MARKIIDIGSVGNDGTGDSIRDSFRKVNDNFRELYSSLGLGERLTFRNLDDTPDSYAGQENAILAVNNTETGLQFKQVVAGTGIQIDFTSNPNEISIGTIFSEISGDPTPQLGGDLSARSGGNQWRILDLTTPIFQEEAATKGYADTKISRAGTNAIDPRTNGRNPDFGVMTGPLILARDPEPDDDEVYNGLIAATKRYVDSSAFGSSANLYVAVSGRDERPGVSDAVQGRALAYAYRTLEAALKKAEELVKESRVEIGPYKKVLTYGNGSGECYLSSITEAPGGGSGFSGTVFMSVSGITINQVGTNYRPGEILTITGGNGTESCRLEILTTTALPGGVKTFRVLSTGVYSVLPGSTNVATTTTSTFGTGATFNLTYSVNNVEIIDSGSGYGLVSVRIVGGGGSGAFGTADVVGGEVVSVTITDKGRGFTSLPTLIVNLPRFKIFTGGARTDYTGDPTDNSPEAIRQRDIREGLYLRGENSGALAQILAHSGQLDGNDEIFDVDIQFGSFQVGEPISYGDVTKNIQIAIFVESGIYEENFPLRVPQNVAIIGDEFRRCIVKPRKGTSSSPWSMLYFRRDDAIDGNVRGATNTNLLAPTGQNFGYHYLHDPSRPAYPIINNPGSYRAAADLLSLNKTFIGSEVIAFINDRIARSVAPFIGFEYNQNICQRDVGLLLDSMIFDLKYGGQDRTISAALKYYQNASGLIAITTQLSQTLAAIDRIFVLAEQILANTPISEKLQETYDQVIDRAYVTEVGAVDVFEQLIDAVKDVIDGSGAVNYPEENDKMDAFLLNDACIIRAITVQGHGGFSMVLDPEGQVLAKSPYIQEAAAFSRSTGAKRWTGGMFVDGFAGNLQFKITGKISNTRLLVSGLKREPKLPASFIVNDTVYRINYVRDYIFDPAGSTAQFVLDENTPWPFDVFTYNEAICRRDVGLIIDGLAYDIALDTNYHARKAGLLYRESNAEVVINTQKDLTVRGISYAHELAGNAVVSSTAAGSIVSRSNLTITKIVNNGVSFAPAIAFTNPPSVPTDIANAKTALLNNLLYIKEDCMGWIVSQIADGNSSLFPTGFVYDSPKYNRKFEAILLAVIYDTLYGGNSQTRDVGLQFYNGVGDLVAFQFPESQRDELIASVERLKYTAGQVLQNLDPILAYTSIIRTSTTPVGLTTRNNINSLFDNIIAILNSASLAPTEVLPSLGAYAYDTFRLNARTNLLSQKTAIQNSTIEFINDNANLFEVLMPGNRSMLSNDFTQVCDMGYGLVTTNGGLTEAVSMFTYYCQISYYAVNGGQIRSIGGSSAHGVFGLVAEGSDPLEVPVPVTVYHEFSQGASVYAPTIAFPAVKGNLFIFVEYDDYVPLSRSELEVDHREFSKFTGSITGTVLTVSAWTSGNDLQVGQTIYGAGLEPVKIVSFATGTGQVGDYNIQSSRTFTSGDLSASGLTGTIVKYPVTSVTTIDLPAGVAKVNLGTATAAAGASGVIEGLFENLPDGYRVTLRTNSQIVLTGDVVTVTTRPSTGLVLDEAPTVYRILEFEDYEDFRSCTISVASETVITTTQPHDQIPGNPIKFSTVGLGDVLPTGLNSSTVYYIITSGFTETSFKISATLDGPPVAVTGAGSGSFRFTHFGLARTTLRENYDYIDFTTLSYQPFRGSTTQFTVSLSNPTRLVSASPHNLSLGQVIRLETTGNLPGGLAIQRNYFVHNIIDATTFEVSNTVGVGSLPVTVSTTGVGTHRYGRVLGEAGDSTFAIQNLSIADRNRISGSVFVWKGEVYEIVSYNPPAGAINYATVEISPALKDDVIGYTGQISQKAAVRKYVGGNLTIRIALTRVTSHDMLEIGTGSYADTNYPSEIFGPPVNPATDANETAERGVGRTFYVTTDQFGNFRVGPYFRVDQGTGNVTFSAAITLSNLDGFGFKRGVPISEFSTDDSLSDNASDTVPTEQAIRTYIERRLGLTHTGNIVAPGSLIPEDVGGYMPLNGLLPMKGNMQLGNGVDNYRITNLNDPIDGTDAVNLRSLVWNNFQEVTLNNVNAADLLTFTGAGNEAVNSQVVGDIRLSFDSTANTVDAQIVPGSIVNTDISLVAGIQQSKLALVSASTRTSSAGITDADKGISSFDDASFVAVNGWITLKNNGVSLGRIQQIAARTVLGNSNVASDNVSAIAFSTVVDIGGAVKKSQYTSTGVLRRKGFVNTGDTDYEVLETTAQSDPSTIVFRDSQRNFSANIVTLNALKIGIETAIDFETSATGGFFQYHGYNGTTGILIGDGTNAATDKTTYYDNNRHIFRTQNRLSFAPITASQIQVNAITTGSDSTIGTITGQWQLASAPGNTTTRGSSRMQATYAADLAEFYEGDAEYDEGTVLVFGGDKEVTISTREFDHRVAGVVSNNAAYSMYGACPGFKNQVALQGRVPCRVVGKIKKGDLMVTSNIPGVAISAGKDAPSGTIIGKSLEDYDSDHIGTIEVAVGRT